VAGPVAAVGFHQTRHERGRRVFKVFCLLGKEPGGVDRRYNEVKGIIVNSSEIAGRIQHTLISNRVTREMWEQHVAACVKFRFHAAMVPAAWVKLTAAALRAERVRVASWIDLPFGTMTSQGKAYEASRLIDAGTVEIDLMPNIGFLLSGMEREFAADIAGVVGAAGDAPVKVILELPLLNARQKERAIALAVEAGAAYLKNASSGAVGIATPEDIRYLREHAPAKVKIKASGGIKTATQVQSLLQAGADLVGTSSGVRIMEEILTGGNVQPHPSSSAY
jgi:deoxyribose-phosphate aldolase